MKVIAINGSPRIKGNTSLLIGEIFEELNQFEIVTKEINVGSKDLKGCIACGGCWKFQDKKCVLKGDDLNEIIEEMLEADAIVLGSPVYCADVSGQMKTFIDDRQMSIYTFINPIFERSIYENDYPFF